VSISFLQLLGFTLLELCLCYMVGRLCYEIVRFKGLRLLHHTIAPALGLSVLALQLWLYGLIHLPWNMWLLLAPWAVAGFFFRSSLFPGKQELAAQYKKTTREYQRLDVFCKVLLAAGSLLLVAFLMRLIVEPLTSSDTMAFWSLKAKEFFYHHAVYVDDFLHTTYDTGRFFHVDYPPLWPLMADVGYVLLGHMQEVVQKTTAWILCLSAVGATYAFARERLDNTKAITVAFIVLAVPQFLNSLFYGRYMAYADYPLAMILLLSAIFIVESLRSKRPDANWALAILFASFAAVTKNEGLPFLAVICLILVGRYSLYFVATPWRHDGWRRLLPLITGSLTVIPLAVWTIYKHIHNLEVEFHLENLAASGMSLGERLSIVTREVSIFLNANIVYWWQVGALAVGLVATAWQRTHESIVVLGIILTMLVAYLLSYIFSPHELHFHVSSSIDRLLTQLVPLTVVLLVTIMGRGVTKDKNTSAPTGKVVLKYHHAKNH
jgi:hypothetical protein